MIVHIAGSIRDFDSDATRLRQVIQIIHDKGGTIAHNWLEPALIRAKEDIYISDWKPYVEANLEAIKRSDLVIIEATHYTFSKGFQVGAALEHNKPTLLVSREALMGKSASGISDPLLSRKTYANDDELRKIISQFIDHNTVHTKDLRFNMLLSRRAAKYLDEYSSTTGKTKSEAIRELIKHKAMETRHRG